MNRLLLALALGVSLAACPGPPGGEGGQDGSRANARPTVNAGADQEATLGEAVHLRAEGEDPDGDALTYAWRLASAPEQAQAQLPAAGAAITFAPDRAGEWVIEVIASDGLLESEADTVLVQVTLPPTLDGELIVTVVDAASGAPLAGAQVLALNGALRAETGADGRATLTDAALTGAQVVTVTGPGTVSLDHDHDAATAEVLRPAWRAASLLGIDRRELEVPLHQTVAARSKQARGRVRGEIDQGLFDLLPELDPVMGLTATDPSSEQLRAVVIGPMIQGPASEVTVADLLGRPVSPRSPLPGNLTTDDLFLNQIAPMLLNTPGEDQLYRFEVDAPAGLTRFFVLGLLIRMDTAALVPLLGGGGLSDPGAILGSMELTTLFAGTVELEVPADGENLLAAPLSVADLQVLMQVPLGAAPTYAEETGPWPLDPAKETTFRRVSVTPSITAGIAPMPALADPRVAANLPTRAPVEIKQESGSSHDPKQWVWLNVPEETGVPETNVPYGLAVALARTPDGLLPLGLVFTRVGGLERPATFALPDVGAGLGAAELRGVSLTSRGLRPEGFDQAYTLLPGLAMAEGALIPGASVTLAAPAAFPSLSAPVDPGLSVYLVLDRDDPTTAVVNGARAYVSGLEAPGPAQVLAGTAQGSLPPEAELAHIIVSLRDRGSLTSGTTVLAVAVDDAFWDVYADASTAFELALPAMEGLGLTAGDELRIEVRAERHASPLDLSRWSGARLREGPASFSSDGQLATWP